MNIASAAGSSLTLPPSPPSTPLFPRTQKARGITALSRFFTGDLVPPFEVHSAQTVRPDQLLGFFSRPCPMRPRHGFVDSRKVTSIEEGSELIRRTLDADPDAEIVTMPLIDATCSGIWTSGLLTVGEGHDGATAGVSAWTLPVLGNLVTENAIAEAGIENTPYVEILWPASEGAYHLVQLRDGPALPQTPDYIPEAVRVEEIIVAQGDLLDWEAKMQQARPGTVVYHPGGSLASHYAIHAVLNHIPLLTSREPRVGEQLEAAGHVSKGTPDIDALQAGFQLATRLTVTYEMAAEAMLAGCHHTSVWAGRRDGMLGLALGFAYRLTVTAALGEMRHAPGRGDDRGRNDIYAECWKRTHLPSTRSEFEKALEAFHGLVWKRSFGGVKWFEFARWAAILHNHLADGRGRPALHALNQLVHCVHNTGWAFNKFIPDHLLTAAARNPIGVLVSCVPIFHTAQRILASRTTRLASRFRRSHTALAIPQGPPNDETYDEDEERYRECERRERRCDESMGRRPRVRERDRRAQSVARRVDGAGSGAIDIPF
jgi:hypothetical protein